MDGTAPETMHELLLALAGRVDDDLLAWARELVAVGEHAHAVELLGASLVADAAVLPEPVRTRLVEVARSLRGDLDVAVALPPAGEGAGHRFDPGPVTDPVAAALLALPARQLRDCRVLLTRRLTPAGSAPGPLPHPVVLVEVEPGTRPTDVVAYQLAVALGRAGVRASVEVLTAGRTPSAYHADALRSARPVRSDVDAPPVTGRRRALEPDHATAAPVPAPAAGWSTPTLPRRAAAPPPSRAEDLFVDAPRAGISPAEGLFTEAPRGGHRAPAAESVGSGNTPVEDAAPTTTSDAVGSQAAQPAGPHAESSPPDVSAQHATAHAEVSGSQDGGDDTPPTGTPRVEVTRAENIPTAAGPAEPQATGAAPSQNLPAADPPRATSRRTGAHADASPAQVVPDPGTDFLEVDPAAARDDRPRPTPSPAPPDFTARADPLNGPLREPLMAPLLDPTIREDDPLGVAGRLAGSEEPARSEWSEDWFSGNWAMPPSALDRPAADPEPAPVDRHPEEGPAVPAPPSPGRRAPRHGSDDEHATAPAPEPAPVAMASVPPPDPEPHPGPDPAGELGLRPESIARLTDADRHLLARLQAELLEGRRLRVSRQAGIAGGPTGNGAGTNGAGNHGRRPDPPGPTD